MMKIAPIFLVVVVMATSAVQGATLNENKKGELKSKPLEGGGAGLDWECPSYCDYCAGDRCYYYDYYYDDVDLAVGWIVAIAITVFIVFFVCIPVGLCFCCGWCCFAGCRKRDQPGIVYVQGPPPAGWGQQPGAGQQQQYGQYPPTYPHQQQYGQQVNT